MIHGGALFHLRKHESVMHGDHQSTKKNNYNKIKIKLKSFKSSEHINEKGDGPYRGFGYLSLFSDPIDIATWNQREFQYSEVNTKTSIVQMGPTILNVG